MYLSWVRGGYKTIFMWSFILAVIAFFFIAGILFGGGSKAEDFRRSSHRPQKGIACKNCGSRDTYKLSKSEKSELCELQYRVNDYKGTISDAYRCNECGHHVWFDHDGHVFYTHD